MSRLNVYTEAPTGGDRFWLDQRGILSGLRYSKTYPGGAANASWQMVLDTRQQHRAWAPGRSVGISCGASTIWTGELDNPTRGTVWQMSAIGAAADAKRFLSIAPTSGNALKLNEVIDAAISRGLRWTRPSSLPSAAASATSPSGSIYIEDALADVLEQQSVPTYWQLDRNRNITAAAAPSTPTHVLMATTPGGGRTLDQFVTDVTVLFQDSATLQVSSVTVSAAFRPFGRFEESLDLTAQGLMTSTDATNAGATFLLVNGARTKFTDAFTVTDGQLLTVGGQRVDLATFDPGVLFNVILTDPDSSGEVTAKNIVTCLAGFTEYDVDAKTLTLGTTDYSSATLSSGLFSGAG